MLKRLLYGLKKSPRQWYLRFDEFIIQQGYVRSCYDNCVYHKWLGSGVGIFLLLYVNDMLVASVDYKEVHKLKQQLAKFFEMKDLWKAKKNLGMQFERDESKGEMKISQTDYL